jgi:hypothetical protein
MTDEDMITGEVITMVREPFAGVRMTIPAGAVIARGRSIRRHRRQGLAAAGAAAAAAVALVIFAVLPGQGTRPAAVRLAAWTVTTEPSGIVAVTIRDLRDPAGLQRALQAHGVPAIVRFHPGGGPVSVSSCMTGVPSRLAVIEQRVFVVPATASGGRVLLYIDPAAVPRTDKITIDAFSRNGISLGLLTRDGRCPPGSRPGRIGMNTIPAAHQQP